MEGKAGAGGILPRHIKELNEREFKPAIFWRNSVDRSCFGESKKARVEPK